MVDRRNRDRIPWKRSPLVPDLQENSIKEENNISAQRETEFDCDKGGQTGRISPSLRSFVSVTP